MVSLVVTKNFDKVDENSVLKLMHDSLIKLQHLHQIL